MSFSRLRRHTLALLLLGLLAWFGQAAGFQRLAQADLPAPGLLAAMARGDLCSAHGGDTLPATAGHDCCLDCVGVAGGNPLPQTAQIAVLPAPTCRMPTATHAPLILAVRYLRHPAREPPLA